MPLLQAVMVTVLPRVVRAYGLRSDVDVAEIPLGHGSRKWLIRSGRRRFVLRQWPLGTSEGRMAFVTASQDRAARRELAAPLHCDSSGLLYHVINAEGQVMGFALTEFVAGHHPLIAGRRTRERLGICLGALHSAYGGVTLPGDEELMTVRSPLKHLHAALRHHSSSSSPQAAILQRKIKLAESRAEIVDATHVPRNVIHGDVHPANIIQRGSGIFQFLDFDRSCLFYRGYEIVRAALQLAGFKHHAWQDSENALRSFLKGYASVLRPSSVESRTMIDMYIQIQLGDTYCLSPSNDGDRTRYAQERFRALQRTILDREPLQELVTAVFEGFS